LVNAIVAIGFVVVFGFVDDANPSVIISNPSAIENLQQLHNT
jgi:hypothetical protein